MDTASSRQVGGDHYKTMGEFQPWDVLRHWLTPEEYRGYQKGVAIAYLARERSKGGDQDIAKATHHLQKLVEVIGDKCTAQVAHDYPDGMVPHIGGSRPLGMSGSAIVDVHYRDGTEARGRADEFIWSRDRDPEPDDIVAWQYAPIAPKKP